MPQQPATSAAADELKLCAGLPKWDIMNQDQKPYRNDKLRDPAVHAENEQFPRLNRLPLAHQVSVDAAEARIDTGKQDRS